LFVPAYWNPPSLFGLAQTTGFDIESLIFSFGIGGIGAVLYNLLTGYEPAPLPPSARAARHHRLHTWALAVPLVSFPLLNLFDWNPIYSAIIAMALGALATLFCRPDLAPKVGVGASLRAVAQASKFDYLSLDLSGSGTVDRKEGATRFTEVVLRLRLTLPNGGDPERAKRMLEKGKNACLVTASLSVPIRLESEIVVESA
jgi:hypothetical protein